MKVLVLGGCGIQGRTAMADLSLDPDIKEIVCADRVFDTLGEIEAIADMSKITTKTLDARDVSGLTELFRQADVVIDLLPKQFLDEACQAAIASGTSVVNTNYGRPIQDYDEKAKKAGVAIMPECGLDPGIDLVIYGMARDRFDTIDVLRSYCGGIPEKSACTNPVGYKVSWTWAGVLSSLVRDSRIITDGQVIDIPQEKIHEPEYLHTIDFPGIGRLEAILNGDAVFFTDLLGITGGLKETGRYSLRWPGWSDFWRPLKKLGFLGSKPVKGLACDVTPMEFLDRLMGPQLTYGRDEKDLVVMLNLVEGTRDGQRERFTSRVVIERDLETGLMAMSRGVGFPSGIVAKMIATGEISKTGVLSPVTDVPADLFRQRLEAKGIYMEETVEKID